MFTLELKIPPNNINSNEKNVLEHTRQRERNQRFCRAIVGNYVA